MAYIYKIENDINKKLYIGKTEFSIEKRWKEHCQDFQKEQYKQRPLYCAMNKYGLEHFYISLIEETDKPEEREIYWIQKLNTYHFGYNATLGGDGNHYIDYNEIIQVYEQTQNLTKTAEITGHDKGHISDILVKNGIHVISNIEMNKKRSIPVVQIDKNTNVIIKIFESARAAEDELKISRHINSVCLGKRKTAGGYKWKYLSDIENLSGENGDM